MSDIVERLRSIDHSSVEDCFLQSPLFEHAAKEIERLRACVRELETERDRSWYDFCRAESRARFAACAKSPHDFVQTIRAMGGEWAGREHEVEFELSRGRAVELLAERERHVFNEQKER
jgi:hypothetical protein